MRGAYSADMTRPAPSPNAAWFSASTLALVVAALATIGTVTFFLTLLKPDLPLVSVLFESASAFGTVGLSVGATPLLGDPGKLIVSALMFIGRVGPVTFGTAFLFRKTKSQFRYPEEKLLVG